MKEEGLKIEEHFPGISYISGRVLSDTQIVVTKWIERDLHRSLRMLGRDVQREDIEAFLEEMERLTAPGDKNNMKAVLHASALADREMYEKMRRDPGMDETLKKILFGDEIDREIEADLEQTV